MKMRGLNGLTALLLALAAFSCSAGQPETTPAEDMAVFQLDAAERAALTVNDDSALTVQFGDPGLGAAQFSVPPSSTLLAASEGRDPALRTASGKKKDKGNKKSPGGKKGKVGKKHKDHWKGDCHEKDCEECDGCGCGEWGGCNVCEDCDCCCDKCVRITGICNLTERFWKAEDACDDAVDVVYEAEVTVEAGGRRTGIAVTFSRDGQVVGTDETDEDGIASFTEQDVPRGPHKVTACVAAGRTGNCRLGQRCSDPDCPTRDDLSCKPQITVVFTRTSVQVTSTKDLSNVVLKFCNGCEKKFEGLCGKTGTFMGYGYYAGKTIAGAWIKSGCNSSGDGPGYGQWFPNPYSDCECRPCVTYDGCSNCSSTELGGNFCSSLDIAVYTDQIWGAVTGTGYIPSCDPLRVGLRDFMNFRAAYDQGQVQGYLNYSGGQYAGAWRISNAPVKWLLISGVASWFGGDNWMVHVVDGGKTFSDDFFEIWIWDPVTKCCYHCGGKLVGCYVNISYRYTQVCP